MNKLLKASSRLESVLGTFPPALSELDNESAVELAGLLAELEDCHMKIVAWIARKRGVALPPVVTSTEVRKVLKE